MTNEEFNRIWSSRRFFLVTATSKDSKVFRGRGTVKTSGREGGTVVFEEEGEWISLDKSICKFRNVYLWSFRECLRFRLAHLRYGPVRPVHLVDFAAISRDTWRCVSPYLCGDDSYAAQMNYSNNKLTLSWRISGPTKRMLVDYSYYK